MFLNSIGMKEDAEKVGYSMKKLGNLVRNDGLVSAYVRSDGREGKTDVRSDSNALWGLFLNNSIFNIKENGIIGEKYKK